MLWLLLTVFFLVLLYFIRIPIELEINTIAKRYLVRFGNFLTLNLHYSPSRLFYIHWKLLLFNGIFYPLENAGSKKRKIINKKTKTRKSITSKIQFVKALLKEIRVKRIYMEIDTGDYLQNAKLFSIIPLLSTVGVPLGINYKGRTNLVFSAYSRPIYLLKGIINYKKSNYGITF